eukprot:815399_1
MSSNISSEIFRGKAFVYVLTKHGTDRCLSGTVIMYTSHINIGSIKWTNNTREIWWDMDGSKLKAKGERVWVMKATLVASDTKQILALRFQNSTISKQFAIKYHEIFPQQTIASVTNPYMPPPPYPQPPHPP